MDSFLINSAYWAQPVGCTMFSGIPALGGLCLNVDKHQNARLPTMDGILSLDYSGSGNHMLWDNESMDGTWYASEMADKDFNYTAQVTTPVYDVLDDIYDALDDGMSDVLDPKTLYDLSEDNKLLEGEVSPFQGEEEEQGWASAQESVGEVEGKAFLERTSEHDHRTPSPPSKSSVWISLVFGAFHAVIAFSLYHWSKMWISFDAQTRRIKAREEHRIKAREERKMKAREERKVKAREERMIKAKEAERMWARRAPRVVAKEGQARGQEARPRNSIRSRVAANVRVNGD